MKHFADLYSLTVEQLEPLERMAAKSAQNVVAAVADSKVRGLARLLAGLGIRHVGGRAAEVLAGHYGDVDALARAGEEELTEIDEMGPIIAASVSRFFASAAGRDAIDRLRDAGVKMTAPKTVAAEAGEARPLAGKTIVVTGTLANYSRGEIKEAIGRHGGKATGSVSAKTDFVLVGEDPGSKAAKARELDIPIISEADFREMIGAD